MSKLAEILEAAHYDSEEERLGLQQAINDTINEAMGAAKAEQEAIDKEQTSKAYERGVRDGKVAMDRIFDRLYSNISARQKLTQPKMDMATQEEVKRAYAAECLAYAICMDLLVKEMEA